MSTKVDRPENFTKEQLISIAKENIELYTMMAGCGHPHVDASECKDLVRTWKLVLQAAQAGLLYQDMKKGSNMKYEVWCAWAEQHA